MLTQTMINNSIKLFQTYLPNLLKIITEKDLLQFLNKADEFLLINDGKTGNANFLAVFLMLIEEVKENKSYELRNELGFFNHLLGKFQKFEKNKEFKNLVLSVINNFNKNDFKNVLGEIAACLHLSAENLLLKYEKIISNQVSIDFEFKNKTEEIFLVDVLNIDYDRTRYEKGEPFEKFITGRLQSKFNEKTKKLDYEEKHKIFIFPIIHGLTIEIVQENLSFLTTINLGSNPFYSFQSFNPMAFAKVQDSFFSLFSMEKIAEGKLM